MDFGVSYPVIHRMLISQAYQVLSTGPTFSLQWKMTRTNWTTVDLSSTLEVIMNLVQLTISRYVSRVVKYNKKSFQLFSCLMNEWISKICKKLKYHGGFLSYLQDRTANSANLAGCFCPALVCLLSHRGN